MFATYVIFCASIHLTFSLPPSKPVNYQLQPIAINSNLYRNQYAYVNRENFERLKDNAQMQALKQNSYPPQNYNINRQGFEQQDTLIQDQKPLLQNLFNPAKPTENQHYQTLAPVQNVQVTNEIINRNIHTSVLKTNLPTISEQRPNILTTYNENIFPSPSIRVPYNAVTRKKAYTIIHPNGTLEESDNLEDVIKLYPKYSLINSNDVQKNTLPPKNPVIQSPERVYAKSPVANPTLVPLFRKPTLRTVPEELPRETMFTNTFKDIKTDKNPPLVTKEIFTKPVEKVALQGPKDGSKTVKNEIQTDYPKPIVDVKVTNIVNKTKESQNDLPRSEQQKTLTVVDNNLSKINQIDRKTLIEDKVVHDSLLQAHLTDQNTVTEKNTNVHNDANADTSLPLDIDIIKDVTNLITSTLSEINNVEDVKVDQADHKLNEDKIANLTDENTTIEINLNVHNNANAETSLPLNVDLIQDVTDLITNTLAEINNNEDDASNITRCINDDEQDDEKIYVPNISLLKDNDTDTPFWFNAADQSVWDMLLGKNNSSAIFFFVPSAVLEKNTSVTIYPNGTRVEETVVIRKEGDKPVVSKTTIITHASDGEINET